MKAPALIIILGVLALLVAGRGAMRADAPTLEERVAKLEERVRRLEASVNRAAAPAPGPTGASHPLGDAIPDDLVYAVTELDSVPGIKRSVEIRLARKVTKAVLQAIAMDIKSDAPKTYERTFIVFYVAGTPDDGGAWATAHFDPDLEVKILGLTEDDEQRLQAEPLPAGSEVLGRWLDESPMIGGRLVLFRKEGKLFMEQTYRDGSRGREEVVERRTALGRRFDRVDGSLAGDHWILTPSGALQIRDRDGLITTAKKLD